MDKKEIIIKQAAFWTSLSERYFEAELTDEEEAALMRFVASETSSDPLFGEAALALFDEVRAMMSLTTVGRMASSRQNQKLAVKELPTQRRLKIPLSATAIRWVAGIAAAAVVVFAMSRWFQTDDDDIYVASVNGEVITDKEKVLTLMHDSWDNIDFQPSANEVEQQMTEMFDGLE